MKTYGEKRDYKKIDLYRPRPSEPGMYYCGSTTWAHNLRFARERYAACVGIPADQLKAEYAK